MVIVWIVQKVLEYGELKNYRQGNSAVLASFRGSTGSGRVKVMD
jgi:hypothetical protein